MEQLFYEYIYEKLVMDCSNGAGFAIGIREVTTFEGSGLILLPHLLPHGEKS